MREFSVPAGTHPHDVAPARDGGIWYTAQHTGQLGWLNPRTGKSRLTRLGTGSAPHGVIVGPGRGAVDHRRRSERDRARRSAHAEGPRFPLPAAVRTRTSTPRRSTRAACSGSPARAGSTAASIRRSEGARLRARRAGGPVRDHDDTGGRRLLRLAGGDLPRADRRRAPGGRPSSARRPPARAHAAPGRTPAVASGSASGTPARSACTTRAEALAEWRVPGAEPDDLRGLRRRARQGLAERFRGKRALAVRPEHARFTRVPLPSADAARAPDSSVDRARSGAPSPAPTSSSWCATR